MNLNDLKKVSKFSAKIIVSIVGIGTTSRRIKTVLRISGARRNTLDVNGAIAAGSYAGTATTSGYIVTPGRVGIGVAAPNYPLEINGSSATVYSSPNALVTTPAGPTASVYNTNGADGSGAFYIAGAKNSSTTAQYGYFGAVSSASGTAPALVFGQRTATPGYTERMRIDSTGNVGIGTTAPAAAKILDIVGSYNGGAFGVNLKNASSGASAQASFSAINDGTASIQMGVTSTTSASDYGINAGYLLSVGTLNLSSPFNSSTGVIKFFTGNTATVPNERARIDNNGNVGIGTNNPQTMLHVNGVLRVDTLSAATATHLCINGSNELSACSSSIRYKENVQDLTPSLEKILNLRPVSYDWIQSREHDVGFIAEEVEKVDDRLVTYNKQGQIQGVKYDQLASPIIKAIQELYSKFLVIVSRQDTQDREIASIKAATLQKADKTETEALRAENAMLKQENAAIKAYLCEKDPKAAICR